MGVVSDEIKQDIVNKLYEYRIQIEDDIFVNAEITLGNMDRCPAIYIKTHRKDDTVEFLMEDLLPKDKKMRKIQLTILRDFAIEELDEMGGKEIVR